jgi:ribosomal protein S18 acetylase RimI-like enzyme
MESIGAAPHTQIAFRIASQEDAPRLIALINAAFSIEQFIEGTRTDLERLANLMAKGSILMAEDASGSLLGSVFMEFRGERGYLGMLAVDPARQRQGLAQRLTTAAEDRFRAAGCRAVEIIVLNMRPELLPLYRRYGYVEVGVTDFNPSRPLKPGVRIHGILMEKQL